jgi:hypothetical protein
MSPQDSCIFKEKIYKDFEKNLKRILGMSFEEFKNVLGPDKDKLTENYEAAYDSGGPERMRFYMNWSISNASIIFTEQDIGRSMTDEEKIDHRNSLGLGL